MTRHPFHDHPIAELAHERIVVLDGAMGTEIQSLGLSDDAFRGDRFCDHGCDLAGNNELLTLTQPDAMRAIQIVLGRLADEGMLLASDAESEDYFGQDVSASAGAIAAGAASNDDSGPSTGSAYVFVNQSGTWVEEAKILWRRQPIEEVLRQNGLDDETLAAHPAAWSR